MRTRTPSIFWLPFVFSVATISWAMLLTGLILLAGVVIAPACKEVCDAKNVRNDIQATVDLLDQKIALQREFIAAATTDPLLMERLAARQLNIYPQGQKFLELDPAAASRDKSVDSLLAESLIPPTPQPPETVPQLLSPLLTPAARAIAAILACSLMTISFFLGVKYERRST